MGGLLKYWNVYKNIYRNQEQVMISKLLSENQLITRKIFEGELATGCSYVLMTCTRKPKIPILIPVNGYMQRSAIHIKHPANV